MPDGPSERHLSVGKGGDPFGDLLLGEEFTSYQLVGEVMAHQGFDG